MPSESEYEQEIYLAEEGIDFYEIEVGLTAIDVSERLSASNKWMVANQVVSGGRLKWRPSFVKFDDPNCLLHIHLSDHLRPFMRERLGMATDDGRQVVIALTMQSLYDSDLLEFISSIDAKVVLIDEDLDGELDEETLLTSLSDNSVPVSASTRSSLARNDLGHCKNGTSHERGKRFEGLLAFLFQQVRDFRVIERNYKGATDEIDLVLQIDNWSGRCWQEDGVPYVLVEAKNWQDPVGKPEVTDLRGSLTTKRRRARIGFLCTTNKITRTARDDELKHSLAAEVIVFIDGMYLRQWIESETPDDELESHVRTAMLR